MNDNIDTLLDCLEQMIAAQDDIWNERYYSNYREVAKIQEDRLLPAKARARLALRDVIADIVKDEIRKKTQKDLELA